MFLNLKEKLEFSLIIEKNINQIKKIFKSDLKKQIYK
jgi:hypothetical protein